VDRRREEETLMREMNGDLELQIIMDTEVEPAPAPDPEVADADTEAVTEGAVLSAEAVEATGGSSTRLPISRIYKKYRADSTSLSLAK
jgi:hypothetical protein